MKRLNAMSRTSRVNFLTYALVIAAFVVLQALSMGGGLSATLRYEPKASQPPKKWTLRLTNRKKDSPGAPERAGVFLFDGISPYGRDIPVDEALVECLRDFFEKRLEDKQREFNELSD